MRSPRGFQVRFALAAFVVTAAPQDATLLQLHPGTGAAAVVESGNDYRFLQQPLRLTRDGVLETTGAGTLTFEYLGHETRWSNSFLVDGDMCFTTGISAVGATCTVRTTAGYVAFEFRGRPGNTEQDAAVWNNRAPPTEPQPFAVGLMQDGPNTFLVLWDDPEPQDADYDDLGVRIVFEPETDPEVDTVGVMLAGLFGAAVLVRRRSRS